MAWQDVVLFVGGFVLAGGIVPAIRAQEKPPVATTLTLVVMLAIFVVVFLTLHLWLTALSVLLQWSLWAIVLAQSLIRRAERNAEAASEAEVTSGLR
ncbi:MAG: hypothetical protein EPO65_01975 [Dehalococcoidia bacterium]|nr:MAG: hypothetical protein EPO65_01975 [Dehalococcoidia bacterium]